MHGEWCSNVTLLCMVTPVPHLQRLQMCPCYGDGFGILEENMTGYSGGPGCVTSVIVGTCLDVRTHTQWAVMVYQILQCGSYYIVGHPITERGTIRYGRGPSVTRGTMWGTTYEAVPQGPI